MKLVMIRLYYNHEWRSKVSKIKGKYLNDKSLASVKEIKKLVEDGKRRGIDEIIKKSGRFINNLKCQI